MDLPTAARFLAQAGLGATAADLTAILQDGHEAWLTGQLSKPLTSPTVFQWAIARGFSAPSYVGSDAGVDSALWARLLGAPDVVRQRMALAWSQIFVVSASNMGTRWGQFAAMAYWDVLEAHGLGTFRQLLKAITLSPAMGVFLNMRGSRKADGDGRQPDENFAREVMQLFTLGVVRLRADGSPELDACGHTIPTYDNEDVHGLAKVFTGWDFDRDDGQNPDHLARPMVHYPAHHSLEEKRFLGRTIPAGTPGPASLEMALDTIEAHPNVAPFVATRLIQQLVTSNPSRAYVARVAQVFVNNGSGQRGDLKSVFRAIVLDPEARPAIAALAGSAAGHGKLREPVLRLVHWARLFHVSSADGRWNIPNLATTTALAQSPLRAPSVFNFFRPGYVPPHTELSTHGLLAPEFQITDEATVIAYANFMQRIIGFGANGVEPDYAWDGWEAMAADPLQLVATLNVAMAGGLLLPETRDVIVQAVSSVGLAGSHPIETPTGAVFADGRRARVCLAVFMVLCSPDFLVQR